MITENTIKAVMPASQRLINSSRHPEHIESRQGGTGFRIALRLHGMTEMEL